MECKEFGAEDLRDEGLSGCKKHKPNPQPLSPPAPQPPSTSAPQSLSPSDAQLLSHWESEAEDRRNPYLQLYVRSMKEMSNLGFLSPQGELQVPDRWAHKHGEFEQVVGSFIDNCVTPARRMYSWAIPCQEALQAIIRTCPEGVLEIGAGTGYWASLLTANGLRVEAYDRFPPKGVVTVDLGTKMQTPVAEESQTTLNVQHALMANLDIEGTEIRLRAEAAAFTNLKCGGAEVAGKTDGLGLMLCWPPRETPLAEDEVFDQTSLLMAFEAVEQYDGNNVVYIGELEAGSCSDVEYGQTAGPKFEAALRSRFELSDTIRLPKWPFAEDKLTIWRRKETIAISTQIDQNKGSDARFSDTRTISQEVCIGGIGARSSPEVSPPDHQKDVIRQHILQVHRLIWLQDLVSSLWDYQGQMSNEETALVARLGKTGALRELKEELLLLKSASSSPEESKP